MLQFNGPLRGCKRNFKWPFSKEGNTRFTTVSLSILGIFENRALPSEQEGSLAITRTVPLINIRGEGLQSLNWYTRKGCTVPLIDIRGGGLQPLQLIYEEEAYSPFNWYTRRRRTVPLIDIRGGGVQSL